MQEIRDSILNKKQSKSFPNGKPYESISIAAVREIGIKAGCRGHVVEREAALLNVAPERYARNFRAISLAEQATLADARAVVVGLGGLGGFVSEILARLGVGHLRLIDGDRFEENNLNRQLFSHEIGMRNMKTDAVLSRIQHINSSVSLDMHDEFLTEENAESFFKDADVAVDCLDSIKTRLIMEKACKKMKVPMVSAAVAGWFGHVTVIYPEDPGLKSIYGDEFDEKGAEADLGCLPFTTAAIASFECAEAVKVILKKDGVLRNKLLLMDMTESYVDVMDISQYKK